MAKKQLYIKIYGKVQGVTFRASAYQKALELGLRGWVKNTLHGGVECLAQGEENQLKKFVSWCKEGPEFANVEDMKIEWSEKEEDFTDFKIIY